MQKVQKGAYAKFLNSLTKEELIDMIISEREDKIPVTIFTKDLAPLESIVKYLKDNKGMTIKKISEKLDRSSKTIWTTYNNVRGKKLVFADTEYLIPISFFSKKTSILETTVYYLKKNHDMTLHQIAVILHRDDRTIWTVYHRAQVKNE
jgi:hypothetical protein